MVRDNDNLPDHVRERVSELRRAFEQAKRDPDKARAIAQEIIRTQPTREPVFPPGELGEQLRRARRRLIEASQELWSTLAIALIGVSMWARLKAARVRLQFDAVSSSSSFMLESVGGIVAVAMLAAAFAGGTTGPSAPALSSRVTAMDWHHANAAALPAVQHPQKTAGSSPTIHRLDTSVSSSELATTPAGTLGYANFDDNEALILTYRVAVQAAGSERPIIDGGYRIRCDGMPESPSAKRAVCTTYDLSPGSRRH